MPQDQVVRFEFGDFALYPDEKILLHFDKVVSMPGKNFEILSYLVQHANAFASKKEIAERVWGREAKIADSNMSHLISKIRKAIGCDARRPKFIKTIYNKNGYRFVGTVRKSGVADEQVQAITRLRASSPTFHLISHLYAPVFLGEEAFQKLNLPKVRNDWLEYKVLETAAAVLCLSPSGFGVWHLTQKHQVQAVTQIAMWRRDTYNEIFDRKHSISSRTKEVLRLIDADKYSKPELGLVGYVFSVIQLEGKVSRRNETTRNLLKTLASLSRLEGAQTDGAEIVKRENSLLSGEVEFGDLEEFGHSGEDLGFAGWGGVSICHPTTNSSPLSESLVEFEIVVQTLWWACKCVIGMRLSDDPKQVVRGRKLTPAIRRMYAQMRTILARETPSQRSMVEAILNTSRIKQMVEAAIDDN
jgi:DNA-binding winged helix-turn-helix (wHTH) protein